MTQPPECGIIEVEKQINHGELCHVNYITK